MGLKWTDEVDVFSITDGKSTVTKRVSLRELWEALHQDEIPVLETNYPKPIVDRKMPPVAHSSSSSSPASSTVKKDEPHR